MPRRPPFRFPRFGWLAVAGLLVDSLIPAPPGYVGPTGGPREWDMSGWDLVCGPEPHPGPPYAQGYHWAWRASAGDPVCAFGGLSFGNPSIAPNIGFDGQPDDFSQGWYRLAGPNTALLPVNRWYVQEQRARPVAGATPVIVVKAAPQSLEAKPVGTPAVGLPPLTPSVGVRPIPVVYAPYMPLPTFPEESDRGWRMPPVGAAPIGTTIRDVIAETPPKGRDHPPVVIKPVPWWVDVKTPLHDVEQKVRDPAGRLAGFFKAVSLYGSANGVIDALWRSLPGHAKTPHARTAQKYADVFRAYASGDINSDAYASALAYWLNYKAAGQLFGTAFRAAEGLGHGGYQLYRAWATGEYVSSGANRLFAASAAGSLAASNARSSVSYQGRRTIERRYNRDLARIEQDFRSQFVGGTSRSKRYAQQRRRYRIRQLHEWRQRSLNRYGH